MNRPLNNPKHLKLLLLYIKQEKEAREEGKFFYGYIFHSFIKEKINDTGRWDDYTLLLTEAPTVRGDHLIRLIKGFLNNQNVIIEDKEFQLKNFDGDFYDLIEEYEEKVLNF